MAPTWCGGMQNELVGILWISWKNPWRFFVAIHQYFVESFRGNCILKFVKMTDCTYACIRLTNFECEVQVTGNGNQVNLLKLAWKNS